MERYKLEEIPGKPHIIFTIGDERYEVILKGRKSKVIETINVIDWCGTIKTGYNFVRGRVKVFYNGHTVLTDKGLLGDMDLNYINTLRSTLSQLKLDEYTQINGFEEIYLA